MTGAISLWRQGSVPPRLPFATGDVRAETLAPAPEVKPQHHVRFAVCGISHDHIHGKIEASVRGGGELVVGWGLEPDRLAVFRRLYPEVIDRRHPGLDHQPDQHTADTVIPHRQRARRDRGQGQKCGQGLPRQ